MQGRARIGMRVKPSAPLGPDPPHCRTSGARQNKSRRGCAPDRSPAADIRTGLLHPQDGPPANSAPAAAKQLKSSQICVLARDKRRILRGVPKS